MARDGSLPFLVVTDFLNIQGKTELIYLFIKQNVSFTLRNKMKVKVKSLSLVRLFATPRTVAYQAPPSMGFSRQEYWSGLPFPSPKTELI